MASRGFKNRIFYDIAGALTMIGLWQWATMTPADFNPELPPKLAEIECPKYRQSEENSALVKFTNRKFYYLCIHDNLLAQKQVLSCDHSMHPPDCGEDAYIDMGFTRAKASGAIYGGWYPESYGNELPTIEERMAARYSNAVLSIAKKPFNLDRYKEDAKKGSKGVESMLFFSDKITIDEDFYCDKEASYINRANCFGTMRSGDAHMRLSVELPLKRGEKVDNLMFRKEVKYWLRFYEQLIVIPDPE